jgi:hypothetical protein
MVVDAEQEDTPFVGGLVTAKQLKKVLPASQIVDTTATSEEIAMAQETVYRDATGRKIDTKAARAEAARQKREREEKEAQKMEWGKGLVQREEQEKRKQEMEKQKGKAFRRVDDADLNEEQKAKELWNDPAAAFLTVCFHSVTSVLHFINATTITEKEAQGPTETRIYWSTSSSESIWDKTGVSVGWCWYVPAALAFHETYRTNCRSREWVREEIVPEQEREETEGIGELPMEC